MNKALTQIQQNLESIKRVTQDKETMEFWSARDLMPMLGYVKWQKFVEVIERAKSACKTSNQPVDSHFLPAPVKSSGGRPKEDMFLTRYACYLIAQNGDPRKPQIALAMTDHNIKDKNIRGKEAMNNEVIKNSKATRQTLLSRDIRPENLKPEEDLKHIESRRKKEQKQLI